MTVEGGRRARRATSCSLLAVLVALLLVGASCSSGDDEASDDTPSDAPPLGVLRMGVTGPLQLDPAKVLVGQEEMIGIDLLYDSLPDLTQPAPDPERRVWTYEIAGATFADGTPITADDVKFSLERIAEPGEQSLRGARLNVIAHLLSQIPYEEAPREKVKLPKRQKAQGYVEPDYPYKFVPEHY